MKHAFLIKDIACALADPTMQNKTIQNLWHNFTFTESTITFLPGEKNTIVFGNIEAPVLPEGKEYSILVNEKGAAVRGASYGALCRGFCDMLMQITPDYENGGQLAIPPMEKCDNFGLSVRMIHFCVFKQTNRLRLKKLLRLCAVLGFTHIILEFWGTIRFDCLPEYGWEGAYSKDEVRELVREIREFGMEPIPMINHLGHAASGRITGGKHAILDQNPKLHRLFLQDGWGWNIFSTEVRELLRKMRAELYDLFGEGEYFHAGLDEAYMFSQTPTLRSALPDYLESVTKEISAEGRRPILWMDMFLPKESGTPHLCYCTVEEMHAFLNKISPDSVLVDWDYDTTTCPLPTSKYLSERSDFDMMTAPWHALDNIDTCIGTVKELGLFGVMMTTWHSMFKNTPAIVYAAHSFGGPKTDWSDTTTDGAPNTETATLLRKLSFEGPNSYEDAGWVEEEVLDTIGLYL